MKFTVNISTSSSTIKRMNTKICRICILASIILLNTNSFKLRGKKINYPECSQHVTLSFIQQIRVLRIMTQTSFSLHDSHCYLQKISCRYISVKYQKKSSIVIQAEDKSKRNLTSAGLKVQTNTGAQGK